MFIDDILRHKIVMHDKFYTTIDSFILFIGIILSIFVGIFYFINHKTNNLTISMLIILFIFYLTMIFVNYKMMTNYYFTDKYVEPEKIINELNTGDIVLFRAYDYDYIHQAQFLAIPLLQQTYFTHIGMIYRNFQNNVMIIEANFIPYKCKLSNKVKNGFQLMNFIDRVTTTIYHRVHVIKSDLYKYIDIDKFYKSIDKYQNYSFGENGLNCLKLVTNILQENGLLKDDNIIPYLLDDLIYSQYYNVPVKFEKPILVKQYIY